MLRPWPCYRRRPRGETTATALVPAGRARANLDRRVPLRAAGRRIKISAEVRHDQAGRGRPPAAAAREGRCPVRTQAVRPGWIADRLTAPQNRPPRRPSAPPPPLSKEALEGNVPLRTFGQLKQLWEARTDEPEDSATDPNVSAPASTTVAYEAPPEAAAPPTGTADSAETASREDAADTQGEPASS